MVILKVFLLLISRPNFLLLAPITLMRFCSCYSASATMAVSSMYRMLFTEGSCHVKKIIFQFHLISGFYYIQNYYFAYNNAKNTRKLHKMNCTISRTYVFKNDAFRSSGSMQC